MTFPNAWWEVAEVIFATNSLTAGDYKEATKNWRKTMIGRGHPLKARDFDNAVRGVEKGMAGKSETIETILARAYWYIRNGIPVPVVRPLDWEWSTEELTLIRLARTKGEPKFLTYDESGIDETPGPATKENPWDKYRT